MQEELQPYSDEERKEAQDMWDDLRKNTKLDPKKIENYVKSDRLENALAEAKLLYDTCDAIARIFQHYGEKLRSKMTLDDLKNFILRQSKIAEKNIAEGLKENGL
jgi:hypothetical protein